MVLTVSFVLSPVTGLFLPLSFVDRLTNLMPASGHQDHTTSPSAASFVRLIDTAASTASHPAFVTIAKRPSSPGRNASSIHLIWVSEKAKYFSKQGWTGFRWDRNFCSSGKSGRKALLHYSTGRGAL